MAFESSATLEEVDRCERLPMNKHTSLIALESGNMKLATTALIALTVQTALFSEAAPKLSLKLERIPGTVTGDRAVISDRAVFVRVWVTNTSQQTVVVPFSPVPELDYMFTIIGPDGRPAPPTRDAEEHRRTVQFSVVVHLLKPDESRTSGYFPMSDVVDFSRPGTYRITATRRYESARDGGSLDETVTSDVLEVKVP